MRATYSAPHDFHLRKPCHVSGDASATCPPRQSENGIALGHACPRTDGLAPFDNNATAWITVVVALRPSAVPVKRVPFCYAPCPRPLMRRSTPYWNCRGRTGPMARQTSRAYHRDGTAVRLHTGALPRIRSVICYLAANALVRIDRTCIGFEHPSNLAHVVLFFFAFCAYWRVPETEGVPPNWQRH